VLKRVAVKLSKTCNDQEAFATGGSVYQIVLARGMLSRDTLDALLRPETLTRPRLV
jgi:aspartate ammonia-lyase